MDDKLKRYVDRFVNLLEEAEANRADQKELAGEIKDDGLTPATVKKLAALAISEKKVARLKSSNEELALYNRESGRGLDLGYETSAEIAVTPEAVDARVIKAIEMLRSGMSIRKVAAALEMGHGTVQRLSQAMARKQVSAIEPVPGATVPPESGGTPVVGTPAHNPDTGEIDEPTVSVSVKHGMETIAESGPMPLAALKAVGEAMEDAGPMPDFLRRDKETVLA